MEVTKHPSIKEIYHDVKSKWAVILAICILVTVSTGWYVKSMNKTYLTKIFLEPWNVISYSNCNNELKYEDLIIDYDLLNSFLYCTYGKDVKYDRKMWRLVKEFLISKKLLNDLSYSKKIENFWPTSLSTHKNRIDFLEKNLFIKARIDESLEDVEVLVVLKKPSLLPHLILNEVIYETNVSLMDWWKSYWRSKIKSNEMQIKINLLSSHMSNEMASGLMMDFKHDLKGYLQYYFLKKDEKFILDIFSKYKHNIPEDSVGMLRLKVLDKILKFLDFNKTNNMINGEVVEVVTSANAMLIPMLAGLLTFVFIILTLAGKKILTSRLQ